LRLVRFLFKEEAKYGILKDGLIKSLKNGPFGQFGASNREFAPDGNNYKLDEVKLLSPCSPSKIVAVGLNYRSHAREMKVELPDAPLIFLKPSTAVIGPGENIVLPGFSQRVDYECELGVVIGREAKGVTVEEAKGYILGYTCFNDVTERYFQKKDGQWTRAKGFDTFAPLGPWIETEVDPGNVKVETYLNGELRQQGHTSDLIFDVYRLLSFISGVMTLLPGDVIATGTPSGIGSLKAGDVVEVRVEKIGTLKNHVVSGN